MFSCTTLFAFSGGVYLMGHHEKCSPDEWDSQDKFITESILIDQTNSHTMTGLFNWKAHLWFIDK
jgi:hypothetical protein